MRYFVAGGAGFIGSHLVDQLLADRETRSVAVLDALTYAADLENLHGAARDPRFAGHWASITDRERVQAAMAGADVVINLAAQTHVDRSIADPMSFVAANVVGTVTLLEAARALGVKRFVQVSTDECYGSVPLPAYAAEDWPVTTGSPYAASKGAADLFVQAYARTYGLPTVITRGANTYGPRQFPEKLVPLAIARALADRPIPLYGEGTQIRDWLYVEDHVRGILHAAHYGQSGHVYNVAGQMPRTNLQVLMLLLELLGKPLALIQPVADRPGHDGRYAMDSRKLETLGWQPRWNLRQGMMQTVGWYARRPQRLAQLLADDPFLQANYAHRGGLS